MNKPLILLCLICFLSSSCTLPSHHLKYEIGDAYEVLQSSASTTQIVPKVDAFNASQLIPPVVIELAWDDHYILTKQLELQADPNNPGAQIPNWQRANYWIIDIQYNQRFGPYTKKQFEAQKQEFRISKSLQLQRVEELVRSQKG